MLTLLFHHVYGWQFIEETYLYHITRYYIYIILIIHRLHSGKIRGTTSLYTSTCFTWLWVTMTSGWMFSPSSPKLSFCCSSLTSTAASTKWISAYSVKPSSSSRSIRYAYSLQCMTKGVNLTLSNFKGCHCTIFPVVPFSAATDSPILAFLCKAAPTWSTPVGFCTGQAHINISLDFLKYCTFRLLGFFLPICWNSRETTHSCLSGLRALPFSVQTLQSSRGWSGSRGRAGRK